MISIIIIKLTSGAHLGLALYNNFKHEEGPNAKTSILYQQTVGIYVENMKMLCIVILFQRI